MPGSGRREWVTRGRHMLRPGLSGVHGRLLPLKVFFLPMSSGTRRHAPFAWKGGTALLLTGAPCVRRALRRPGGGPHGQSPDNQKGKTSPGGQLRKNGFPGCKKTSVPGKDGGFRIFSEAGAYCTLSLGIPLPMGPYWAS